MNARRWWWVGALGLAGCAGTLERATRDATVLAGQIPQQLGRELRVELEGADAATRDVFLAALRTEFEGRDLFDRVRLGQGKTTADATLSISLVEREEDELFDLWEFTDAYVVRYELEVELVDPQRNQVLSGHISGIGADSVSDDDDFDDEARRDVDLAAVSDAATKLSRNLRLAADRRGRAALDELPEVLLPPGEGPVSIAVLEVEAEDPRAAVDQRARLAVALAQLGTDFFLVPGPAIDRALEDAGGGTPGVEVDADKLAEVARRLRARYLVRARVRRGAERVEVQAELLDRDGTLLKRTRSDARGLGAPQVAACHVAQTLGREILAIHSTPTDSGDSSQE
ncbi:MAG: hypothetical protein R3F62_06225 [Planctomycetota bacterium]